MKCEGMPTQRHEEKRVEEHASAWGLAGGGGGGWCRERERACWHMGERERVQRVREGFGSSFYMFFPPPGPALCKLG